MASSAPAAISRYQVLNRLDEGGAGNVYLARDPGIDRLVAIKLLREGCEDPAQRERVVREARSAGRLRHPNIVTVFDVGDQGDELFITMEFVQGVTLHDLIRRPAPLPLVRKLRLMDELCAGLQYAHRAGLIHGDIKPRNLMMDEDGALKILDFGIPRVGPSAYTSPEQIGGHVVDARADMFSAGAVFYELLSHRCAFAGDTESDVLRMIASGRPEPLETIQPDLDGRLISIVNRCLEKMPTHRYPDMAAVREELAVVRQRVDPGEYGGAIARAERTAPDRERVSDRTRRAEEEVARARALIRTARQQFDAGNHEAAIAGLEAFQPARLVANALAGFRADLQRLGTEAAIPFTPPPPDQTVVVSPSETAARTPAAVPADSGDHRTTTSVIVAVAIAAAVAALVWILLSLLR
jgi:serine/threonine-protein kinase